MREKHRRNVLIIDRDASARELARDTLAGRGCGVIETAGSLDGIVAA